VAGARRKSATGKGCEPEERKGKRRRKATDCRNTTHSTEVHEESSVARAESAFERQREKDGNSERR